MLPAVSWLLPFASLDNSDTPWGCSSAPHCDSNLSFYPSGTALLSAENPVWSAMYSWQLYTDSLVLWSCQPLSPWYLSSALSRVPRSICQPTNLDSVFAKSSSWRFFLPLNALIALPFQWSLLVWINSPGVILGSGSSPYCLQLLAAKDSSRMSPLRMAMLPWSTGRSLVSSHSPSRDG